MLYCNFKKYQTTLSIFSKLIIIYMYTLFYPFG